MKSIHFCDFEFFPVNFNSNFLSYLEQPNEKVFFSSEYAYEATVKTFGNFLVFLRWCTVMVCNQLHSGLRASEEEKKIVSVKFSVDSRTHSIILVLCVMCILLIYFSNTHNFATQKVNTIPEFSSGSAVAWSFRAC